MEQYQEMLKHVLENGRYKEDRTGVGCYSVIGYQNRYDLNKGFPIVTTKKLLFNKAIYELLWFLTGSTNLNDLHESAHPFWKPWAKEDGSLGKIYGHQWRRFNEDENGENGVDQIKSVIKSLKESPFSRRHVVTAWNPSELNQMALNSCHCLFQFFVEELTLEEREGLIFQGRKVDGDLALREGYLNFEKVPKFKLSCQLYQRSADIFLGIPVNISSYALLTHMIAQVCGYAVGEFIHSFGDLHLYANHVEQAKLQLERNPYKLPKLWLNPEIKDIDDFKFEDIRLEGYEHHPFIKAPVAV